MLESAKDRIFTGPAVGIVLRRMASLRDDDSAQSRIILERLKPLYESTCRVHNEMRRRGIRVVIGGDYGFDQTPQGTNARDIEHFVKLFGYSPAEALACATRYGAELMGLGGELGQVREGFLADLLLVDGDPLADVAILQRQDRLAAILQNGVLYKLDRTMLARRQVRAAE
jgi:imidazolonepropionase-like amidohydrolase